MVVSMSFTQNSKPKVTIAIFSLAKFGKETADYASLRRIMNDHESKLHYLDLSYFDSLIEIPKLQFNNKIRNEHMKT